MGDLCDKCGNKVDLLAHIGEWNDETDLYNYVCPHCGDSGIKGMDICEECHKGILEFSYTHDFIDAGDGYIAAVFTCDYCGKEYLTAIKNSN